VRFKWRRGARKSPLARTAASAATPLLNPAAVQVGSVAASRYDARVTESILRRIPVVGGVAYIEHIRRLPSAFTATLHAEPDNRYFQHAIAVVATGHKVGYVAPEIARSFFERVRAAAQPLTCQGRPARHSDHESSGVELLLDFSTLDAAAE
jgi:hypothetical protein